MIPLILSGVALVASAAMLFRVWKLVRATEALLDRIQIRDPYGSCENAGSQR